MLKILRGLLMLTGMLMLGGCLVQSVNRYYTDAAVCTIPSIAGEWRPLDDKGAVAPGKPWLFQDNKVVTYEKNNVPATIKVTYFKLGDTYFVDSTADDPAEESNHWWTMHVFPVHLVAKVEFQGNRLTLTPPDSRWLEQAIKEKKLDLPHIRAREGGVYLFTPTPEAWEAFLKKYAADKNVFSETNALRFRR